ncbi:hypothetical protein [Streptomyces indicus]|uniref:Uncharacterized protein n=1 Tax=Streptomyces indicus TaxID=417292 RepID=A0A1G9IXM9_9ACTN|nr:hypothetical protein [Streptomyces indicus]SDL29987.1 hypothetical protein SAMN05421806_1264 [Streptomyces indicus]
MSDSASFRYESNWGGCYELSIEVGTSGDAELQTLLSALWSVADMLGCFGRCDREHEYTEVPCTVASLSQSGQLVGQIRLPTGRLTVSGCTAVRGGDGSDWLDLSIPTSELDEAGIEYHADDQPFFRSAVLDDWLAGIASATFQQASFSLAIVGWMISGGADAAMLAGELPQERAMGYLLPRDGVLH